MIRFVGVSITVLHMNYYATEFIDRKIMKIVGRNCSLSMNRFFVETRFVPKYCYVLDLRKYLLIKYRTSYFFISKIIFSKGKPTRNCVNLRSRV